MRKKLGLSEDTSLRFARLHEGKVIELDDGKFYISFDLPVPHPMLCTDEDFEAFRHLARHVHTLDVSVFVGQNGPDIFTQQLPRESSTIPVRQIFYHYSCGMINILQNTSKKRSKSRRTKPSIIHLSSEAATRDVTSRKDQRPNPPHTTSTLEAHGVTKKKRNRKGMSPSSEFVVSSLVQPEDAPQTVPEGHEGWYHQVLVVLLH